MALYNLRATWPLANGGGFQLLDYQVPLKSRQADAGVGKVDLLGLASDGRLVVIELKTVSASGGRGQAPPAALMEGLRYAAMLEADRTALAAEIKDRHGRELSPEPPLVALLAPRSWWRAWRAVSAAGDWAPLMARIFRDLEAQLGVAVACLALSDVDVSYGCDGRRPEFGGACNIDPFELVRGVA